MNSTKEKATRKYITCFMPRLMASFTTVRLIFPSGIYPTKFIKNPIRNVKMSINDA
jgi:hypothetical protein